MSITAPRSDQARSVRPGRASTAKILSSAANGLTDFIMANGADPAIVLKAVGMDEHDVRSDSEPLELHRYCELIEVAAHHTSNDNFGLQFGQGFGPERLGLIGEIVLASATLGASLRNLADYFPYHQQNTEAAFRRTGALWRLEYRILDGRILQRRQHAELTLGMYLNVIRRCLGCHWAPDEVYFEHPRPEDWQAHQSVFSAPVFFNMPNNALVFGDRDLAQPLPGWDAVRMQGLCDALTMLSGSTGTLSLPDQVTGQIRSLLPSGYPHIEDVADALQMTRWTLQRRLADQGRVFSDLVDETRHRLATAHLGDAHLPIRDVADCLGYSELSAFSRACVRWFQASPSRVRERLLNTMRSSGSSEMSTGSPPRRPSVS